MKKKIEIAIFLLFAAFLGGCGNQSTLQETEVIADTVISLEANTEENTKVPSETLPEKETENKAAAETMPTTEKLADGIYTAEFITDSSMFRVNETCEGKGTLTVENGEMTIHISLGSKHILKLYLGLAQDAEKEEDTALILPTEDTVTYSDGMTEEVHGFDVPVPELEAEFDLALIGTKGKWYDHKVRVSNPIPAEDNTPEESITALEDGTYRTEITFAGGSGKAEILSPVLVTITDQTAIATVQWNSPNYDYMLVNGEKYLPVNTDGDSVFEIPVLQFDAPMNVIGDTVAMSKPHEVEYTITFHSDTMQKD